MAGTVVTPPHGFEIVGDAVPTVEHWKSFAACPADFEPNDVWGFVQKVKETSSGKLLSWCVFCRKFYGGHNATKMLLHPSGMYSSEIITCLGISNGSITVWMRDRIKAAVVKKANDQAAKKEVRLQPIPS